MNIILQKKARQGKNRGRLIVTKFKLLREQCNEIVTKNKTYFTMCEILVVFEIEEVNKWLKY